MKNEVLQRAKKERSVPHTIRRKKANCIGQILRSICLIKHVILGKMGRYK